MGEAVNYEIRDKNTVPQNVQFKQVLYSVWMQRKPGVLTGERPVEVFTRKTQVSFTDLFQCSGHSTQ